jgi:hypothetical protein
MAGTWCLLYELHGQSAYCILVQDADWIALVSAEPENRALLQSWLSELFAGAVQVSKLRRLSGGAVQDNWAVDVDVRDGDNRGGHALVLRVDAPSSLAASLSRSDEFAVLRAAHEAGVCVPEPPIGRRSRRCAFPHHPPSGGWDLSR